MCRCLSDVLVDVLTDDCDPYSPLDQKSEDITNQVFETVQIIEDESNGTDCSQLHLWLAQTIESLEYEERALLAARMAWKIRSQAYSIWPLEQAWEAAFWRREEQPASAMPVRQQSD